MRFENGPNWIDIDFIGYTEDAKFFMSGLTDEHNSVEIILNYSFENFGWGCVGDEYFHTSDIKELATGTAKVLYSTIQEFSYSVAFPYKSALNSEFCKFHFFRQENGITVNLQIHDGLSEYIEISQTFEEQGFEAIVQELKETSRRFPMR